MSNEDKILTMLGSMQADMETLKADVAEIKSYGKKSSAGSAASDLEIIRKMSKLLTKEEADDLAAVVAAQKARVCV